MDPQSIEDEFIKKVYSSRDIRLAHPDWLKIWPALKDDFGMETGLALEISCTFRSCVAQYDLYQMGRTKPGKIVTHFDGLTRLSVHNIFPSKAIDVYIHQAGKVLAIWDFDAFEPLKNLADKYSLIWGGNWKKFADRPHLE